MSFWHWKRTTVTPRTTPWLEKGIQDRLCKWGFEPSTRIMPNLWAVWTGHIPVLSFWRPVTGAHFLFFLSTLLGVTPGTLFSHIDCLRWWCPRTRRWVSCQSRLVEWAMRAWSSWLCWAASWTHSCREWVWSLLSCKVHDAFGAPASFWGASSSDLVPACRGN